MTASTSATYLKRSRRRTYPTDTDYEAFAQNDMMIDGVVKELEIIGEAARSLSSPFIEAHGDIPWRRITATRKVPIH